MCGRATLTSPVEDIAEALGVSAPIPFPALPPRFNIAPTQDLVVVRAVPGGAGGRELAVLRWGLVPWWSKDTKMAGRGIQARIETAARTPAFREAFKSRRCLVVIDGFFEWSGPRSTRTAHHIRLAGGVRPFTVAGLWDCWKTADGTRVETCAVVTTAAREPVLRLHDRMPLVLAGEDRDHWLSAPPEEVPREPSLVELELLPVSAWVNDVRHDDPRCLEPAAPPPPSLGQATLRFE